MLFMSIQYPVRQRAAGNTMTEYLFIAFLILVVSVGTWMTIGKGLNGMATRLKTEFKEKGDLATAKQTALSSLPKGPTGINLSGGVTATTNILMDCNFKEKKCLVKEPPPFTSGGNGSDILAMLKNMMTTIFRAIGIEVQTEPDALLTRMAQNGYKIAFLQKIMESLKTYTAEDIKRLKDTTIQIEGKSYKVQELVAILKDLNDQVKADKTNVENTSLPSETKDKAKDKADDIDDSSKGTTKDMEDTLAQEPPPDGAPNPETSPEEAAPPLTDSPDADDGNRQGSGPDGKPSDKTTKASDDLCELSNDPDCPPKKEKDPSLTSSGPTPL
jgi:hypothetical protein